MAKALLIAEKPSLMREAEAAYKKYGFPDQIDFKAFVGHTMTLLAPEDYHSEWADWKIEALPLVPDQFKYKPTADKEKIYNELKHQIETGNYDYLINCCDPGREGQHIFHNFYRTIGCKLPVKRMWHNDVTLKGMKRAFDHLRDDLHEPALVNMTEASMLRAYFDWLIGMNFSRAFTLVGNKKVAIGRVMTPTLRLVVERELELQNFQKQKFWELIGDFGAYQGLYQTAEGDTRIMDPAVVKQLIQQVEGKTGEIVQVETERQTRYAPKLYALSDIQGDANESYGYTMAETLKIIQTLYESKILSYPRTDSNYITEAVADDFPKMLQVIEQIPSVQGYVQAILKNPTKIKEMSRHSSYVDDKKVSDHYAIVPTGTNFDFNKLTKPQQNILELVAKRLVSIFLPPIQMDKSVILTVVEGHQFKTNGSILVDPGYSVVYGTKFKDKVLPVLTQGASVVLAKTDVVEKETKPPKRYTEKSLGNALKYAGRLVEDEEMKQALNHREGIGTPATRGDIVEKLVKIQMIERKKNNLHATPYGISIIQHLNGHPVTSPELTGTWEGKLLKIEACELKPTVFYQEMIEYIKKETETIKQMNFNMASSSLKSLGNCPRCGKPMLVGKNYYLCQEYNKTCKFVIAKETYGAKITETDVKAIIDGKMTKEKTFKFKKDGKEIASKGKLYFNSEEQRVRIQFSQTSSGKTNATPLGKCPKCGKAVVSGNYYRCEGYKETCDFIMSKTICQATINEADMKTLLTGGVTAPKNMVFKSGKSGTASLYLEKGELKFKF